MKKHIGGITRNTKIVLISAAVVVMMLASVLTLALLSPSVRHLRLATTTSTQDSGLLDYILPVFENRSNCEVEVIAAGSGQAMEMGKRGDVDILIVHSPISELQFMSGGYGTNRTQLMYNWFIVVGPDTDPAGTRNAANASAAFKRILENGTAGSAIFVSRADNSGTHTKELSIWSTLGYNRTEVSAFDPSWYKQAGQGMGAVLDMCEDMVAYTLSDDATYYSRAGANITPSLNITKSGDAALKNQYTVILVNSTMWPHINRILAMEFLSWIISDDAQDLIKSYERYGLRLFTPNAPGYAGATSLTVVSIQSEDRFAVYAQKGADSPKSAHVNPMSCAT